MDYALVIPARLASTRLPRKPLVDICGKTMIEHTYSCALAAVPAEKIFIATDSDEILRVCEGFGAQVVLTSSNCLTGTDRVAQFAEKVPADIYLNLQGDEPLMAPENIKMILEAGLADKKSIINGWAWVKDENEYYSKSVPKVVMRQDGRMMYMSRSPIPGNKCGTFQYSRKQICVYSFPRAALKAFSENLGKTPNELVEDIEILRFSELGWEVKMIELEGNSIAVDLPEDLEKVRDIMVNR